MKMDQKTEKELVQVADGVFTPVVLSKQMIQIAPEVGTDGEIHDTFVYLRAVAKVTRVSNGKTFNIWSPWTEGPRNVTQHPLDWFTDRKKNQLSNGAKAANQALSALRKA